MNAQCVSALVARAEKVDVAGLGSVEACAKLESTFKETVDSACVGFADGNTWTGVSVKRKYPLYNVSRLQQASKRVWIHTYLGINLMVHTDLVAHSTYWV